MADLTSGAIYRHFYSWFVTKVAFPFICLGLIWFFYILLGDLQTPFIAAFAHGELLVFAAVLLIELSFEGDELRGKPDREFHSWFDKGLPVLKLMAFILICVFGFIKYDVTVISARLEHGHSGDLVLEMKLRGYACLSLAIAVSCICISVYACFAYCNHELENRLEAIKG
jgi:hypothetical protein